MFGSLRFSLVFLFFAYRFGGILDFFFGFFFLFLEFHIRYGGFCFYRGGRGFCCGARLSLFMLGFHELCGKRAELFFAQSCCAVLDVSLRTASSLPVLLPQPLRNFPSASETVCSLPESAASRFTSRFIVASSQCGKLPEKRRRAAPPGGQVPYWTSRRRIEIGLPLFGFVPTTGATGAVEPGGRDTLPAIHPADTISSSTLFTGALEAASVARSPPRSELAQASIIRATILVAARITITLR